MNSVFEKLSLKVLRKKPPFVGRGCRELGSGGPGLALGSSSSHSCTARLARKAQGAGGRASEWMDSFYFCFCMFNIEVPLIPWEIMAFEYAHNL